MMTFNYVGGDQGNCLSQQAMSKADAFTWLRIG
jgi:hypothetical protein